MFLFIPKYKYQSPIVESPHFKKMEITCEKCQQVLFLVPKTQESFIKFGQVEWKMAHPMTIDSNGQSWNAHIVNDTIKEYYQCSQCTDKVIGWRLRHFNGEIDDFYWKIKES